MRLNITDLAIRKLSWNGKQTTYWDTNLKGFGVRVSKHKKSYVVMVGRQRKLITLFRYGDKPLKDARSDARALLVQWSDLGLKTPQDAILGFSEHIKSTTRSSTTWTTIIPWWMSWASRMLHRKRVSATQGRDSCEHMLLSRFAFLTGRSLGMSV